MQKVSKELLTDLKKGKVQPAQVDTSNIGSWDLNDPSSLLKLAKIRESTNLLEVSNLLFSWLLLMVMIAR
jgi:hypothetical protein